MVPRLFQSTEVIQQCGLKCANMLAGQTVRESFKSRQRSSRSSIATLSRSVSIGSSDDRNGQRFNLCNFQIQALMSDSLALEEPPY